VQIWDETVQKITAAMAKKKLSGERPTVVTTPNFKIKISKSREKEGRIIHAERGKLDESKPWISLPKLTKLPFFKRNESENIFTEVRHIWNIY
jgi:hypothetical protein